MIILRCSTCDKEFESKWWEKRKYCSVKCIKRDTVSLNKAPRYQAFWKNASEEQKLERYKKLFEERVIKQDGCWGWKSFINSTGCGVVGSTSHIKSAYRVSWLIHRGEIPKGLCVLHKCHNRVCTNPDHLYCGTPKDNSQDMIRAGRGKHCQQSSKNAKLDKEKASMIKQLLKEGITWKKIAEQFGVSQGTVQDIKRNKMWKDA